MPRGYGWKSQSSAARARRSLLRQARQRVLEFGDGGRERSLCGSLPPQHVARLEPVDRLVDVVVGVDPALRSVVVSHLYAAQLAVRERVDEDARPAPLPLRPHLADGAGRGLEFDVVLLELLEGVVV